MGLSIDNVTQILKLSDLISSFTLKWLLYLHYQILFHKINNKNSPYFSLVIYEQTPCVTLCCYCTKFVIWNRKIIIFALMKVLKDNSNVNFNLGSSLALSAKLRGPNGIKRECHTFIIPYLKLGKEIPWTDQLGKGDPLEVGEGNLPELREGIPQG